MVPPLLGCKASGERELNPIEAGKAVRTDNVFAKGWRTCQGTSLIPARNSSIRAQRVRRLQVQKTGMLYPEKPTVASATFTSLRTFYLYSKLTSYLWHPHMCPLAHLSYIILSTHLRTLRSSLWLRLRLDQEIGSYQWFDHTIPCVTAHRYVHNRTFYLVRVVIIPPNSR